MSADGASRAPCTSDGGVHPQRDGTILASGTSCVAGRPSSNAPCGAGVRLDTESRSRAGGRPRASGTGSTAKRRRLGAQRAAGDPPSSRRRPQPERSFFFPASSSTSEDVYRPCGCRRTAQRKSITEPATASDGGHRRMMPLVLWKLLRSSRCMKRVSAEGFHQHARTAQPARPARRGYFCGAHAPRTPARTPARPKQEAARTARR